jgi:PAS domain S-box-containing protein
MKPISPPINISNPLGEARDNSTPPDDAAQRLELLLRVAPDGIVSITEDGVVETFNPGAERLFGYSAREMLGQNISVLMPEPYRSEHTNYLKRHIESGSRRRRHFTREVVALRKDGTSFPAELTVTEFQLGARVLFTGIVRDISEFKRAKNSYLQKTSEIQAIFEVLPDSFFRVAPDGSVLDYHLGNNSRLPTVTDRYLGGHLPSLFPAEIAQRFADGLANVNLTSQLTRFEFSTSGDGHPIAFEVQMRPFLRQQVLVVIRDITAEYQATDTNNRYHALDAVLPVGIFRTDAAGNLSYVNSQWSEIANLPTAQAVGNGWLKALHPEDRLRIIDQWRKCVEEQAPFKAEFRFQHSDGIVAWVYCQAVAERDSHGQVAGYVGTVIDITDRIKADEALRKARIDLEMRVEERTADLRATNRFYQQSLRERTRAEQALREERNFISTILETTGALVVVCDRQGRVIEFNRSCQRTSGCTAEDVRGKFFWEILQEPHAAEETREVFQRLVDGAERVEHENYWQTRSQQQRLIAWTNTTVRGPEGQVSYVICTGIDITEQRQAEEEARQRQADLVHVSRLCTMGEMAAGLAHELNQPLAAIVSYTQGCVRRIANGAPSSDILEAMKQVTLQAQRAGEIIKHLRNFVAKGEPQRTVVHINTLVREVLNVCKVDVRKQNATVRLRLTDNLPVVGVDMIQIEQVLVNLLRNGLEAMASTERPQRELLVRTFLNDKQQIEVSVCDAGEGLPKNLDPEKVFEAFFTTKKEGMGMGLAISRSIIEAHGGRLWAERNPDRGTTFHFTLPV